MNFLARHVCIAVALFVCAVHSSAYAGIGGVGSPVVSSNTPPAQDESAAPAAKPATEQTQATTEAQKPLLVIRYAGQKHVYFERSLRVAVEKTEKAKAGAKYSVVSVIPGGKNKMQNQRIGQETHAQLKDVTQELRKLGVPGSRVSATTTSSENVAGHEIRIYVY